MTQSDPFAAVAVNNPAAPAAPAAGGAGDPFTPATDSADPFATSSDFRGSYIPSPSPEVLAGRTLVLIPRRFDPVAENPFAKGADDKTRELYYADLTIVDGGALAYEYRVKGDPEKGTEDEYKTWTIEADAIPYTIENFWVPWGNIIAKLKKSHAAGAPFLGSMLIVPTATERKKGTTNAQAQAQFKAWDERGRKGQRPSVSWAMEDPTPAGRAAAVAWWGKVRADIAPIDPSKAPRG